MYADNTEYKPNETKRCAHGRIQSVCSTCLLAAKDTEIDRLTKDNTALRKALLSAQARLNSPLNLVKCKGFGELMRKINETLKETEV